MNFQKFIYDFLKFNDFSANFHDILRRAMGLKSCAMGVSYRKQGDIRSEVEVGCSKNLRSCKKQALRLRDMGVANEKMDKNNRKW